MWTDWEVNDEPVEKSSNPYKGRTTGYVGIPCHNLQISSSLRPPKHNDPAAGRPCIAARDEELFTTLLMAPEFHPPNLMQPGENLFHQNETFVRSTMINMFEYGYRIP